MARLDDGRHLNVANWQLGDHQTWAITGTNGSGKTLLSRLLLDELVLSQGEITQRPESVAYVSLESQSALIELERAQDESDLNEAPDPGTLVKEYLDLSDATVQHWVEVLGIGHLLDQGLRSLSTGESRKVLWVHQVALQPTYLVLDEPLEGLDQNSRLAIEKELEHLHRSG